MPTNQARVQVRGNEHAQTWTAPRGVSRSRGTQPQVAQQGILRVSNQQREEVQITMYHSRRRHPSIVNPESSDHKYRTLLKEVLDLKRKPHETGHMWRLKQYESLLLSRGTFEGNLGRLWYAISLMQNGHYHIRMEKQEYAPVFADTEPAFLRAAQSMGCLLYTSPSPRDRQKSRMPSSA